jgi:Nucleoside-diphosphate-sugar epimerases
MSGIHDYAGAYRGSRVLITGGMGFIGSNLAHRLVELDAQVTLVDSLIPIYGGTSATLLASSIVCASISPMCATNIR